MSKLDVLTVKEYVYDKCFFDFTDLLFEKESSEYSACSFQVNGLFVIGRSSKITPKKAGQFVTFWKRKGNGPIQPFEISDNIDFFVVNTRKDDLFGQFVFPKKELLSQGIISNPSKEGKRGFRVYPPWDRTTNKQAQKTQKWQLKYFLSINECKAVDLNRARLLYSKNEGQ